MLDIKFPIKKTTITIDSKAQKLLDHSWTASTGLPLFVLMEQAAMAVTEVCLRLIARQSDQRRPECTRILILGGKGNNGGDAWACARQLAAFGLDVDCCDVLPADSRNDEAGRQFSALHEFKVNWLELDELQNVDRPDIIIDGMLGSGYRAERGLPDNVRTVCSILDHWRDKGSIVVAIDLPSGVDADTGAVSQRAVAADYTVTFAACKTGLAAAPGSGYAGRVIVEPISMPADWINIMLSEYKLPRLLILESVKKWRPFRPSDGHKGTFGRVLVVGGSKGMAGAVCLAARAAAKAGAGLIYLVVDNESYTAVLPDFPEGLTNPVAFDHDAGNLLTELSANKQVIAIGPGLGSPVWLQSYLLWLLANVQNLVLDADALNEISCSPEVYLPSFNKRSERGLEWPVLTPHPGEFARLAPDLAMLIKTDRQSAALQLAARMDCIVVLKGASTVIATPKGDCFINTSGNDGMAKGGSGDCLTGIIAGIAAQGLSMINAACAGVFLHGLAGDLAAARTGKAAMLPTDLLTEIGEAWQQAEWLPGENINLIERMDPEL